MTTPGDKRDEAERWADREGYAGKERETAIIAWRAAERYAADVWRSASPSAVGESSTIRKCRDTIDACRGMAADLAHLSPAMAELRDTLGKVVSHLDGKLAVSHVGQITPFGPDLSKLAPEHRAEIERFQRSLDEDDGPGPAAWLRKYAGTVNDPDVNVRLSMAADEIDRLKGCAPSSTATSEWREQLAQRIENAVSLGKDICLRPMEGEEIALALRQSARSATGTSSGDLKEYGELAWNDAIEEAIKAADAAIDPAFDGLRVVTRQALEKLRRQPQDSGKRFLDGVTLGAPYDR